MKMFTEHPETVGETYVEHLRSATSFAILMIGAGFACLLHGLFPFIFINTGSQAVTKLHRKMVTHRDKRQRPESATATYPNVA